MDANDPFKTFYLSAYIRGDRDATITGSASPDGGQSPEGQHVWLVGDIGAGQQLLGAICEGPCIDYQRPVVDLPKFHDNAETSGPDSGREPGDIVSEAAIAETGDFAGETLILQDATTEQEIESISLEERTGDMLVHERAIIAFHLDKLGGAEASEALGELFRAGLVGIEIEDWEFEGYEQRHVITLRPARPKRLTAVRLMLSKPAGRSILQDCVPKVEIAHADHDRIVHAMALDHDSQVGDSYREFVVRLGGDDSVLAEPPEDLSLRIFIGSGSGEAPTCKLTRHALFPRRRLSSRGSRRKHA